jgi:hypothetical protein
MTCGWSSYEKLMSQLRIVWFLRIPQEKLKSSSSLVLVVPVLVVLLFFYCLCKVQLIGFGSQSEILLNEVFDRVYYVPIFNQNMQILT